jgi:hypothetical protein
MSDWECAVVQVRCPKRLLSVRSLVGFTLVELLFAVAVAALVSIIFFGMLRTMGVIRARVDVQSELHVKGKIALEKIQRSIREEMVGLSTVSYQSGAVKNALIIVADANHDGVGDSLKGWGVRALDGNLDGSQDKVDTNGDGVPDTALWELVQVTSTSTNLASAAWTVTVLCKNLTVPWLTVDGVHNYRPFEYVGSDPALDVGLDGIDKTGDSGEHDGYVSETEIGNSITGDGVIDHAGEVEKVATIGVGLRFLKISAFGKLESVIVYRGTVDPRNWQPLYYKN